MKVLWGYRSLKYNNLLFLGIENRIIWTARMMTNLLEGVNTVGRGRWKGIFEKYNFPKSMTVTKVASKWHYMTRRNLVAHVGREWVLTCKMEDLVDNATPTATPTGTPTNTDSNSECTIIAAHRWWS